MKRYEKAWDNLHFEKSELPDLVVTNVWEMVGNVLALRQPHENGPGSSITFKTLPSPLRQIPSRTWTLSNFTIPIKDFQIDVSQDLLVVLFYECAWFCHPRILISSEYLALCEIYSGHLFPDFQNTLHVWNWNTGEPLLVRTGYPVAVMTQPNVSRLSKALSWHIPF